LGEIWRNVVDILVSLSGEYIEESYKAWKPRNLRNLGSQGTYYLGR
jgi:hypothetical protein